MCIEFGHCANYTITICTADTLDNNACCFSQRWHRKQSKSVHRFIMQQEHTAGPPPPPPPSISIRNNLLIEHFAQTNVLLSGVNDEWRKRKMLSSSEDLLEPFYHQRQA